MKPHTGQDKRSESALMAVAVSGAWQYGHARSPARARRSTASREAADVTSSDMVRSNPFILAGGSAVVSIGGGAVAGRRGY